jgi:hypothetical protein
MKYSYMDGVKVSFSRFLNSILGGDFDQMISSRVYLLKDSGPVWSMLYRILNLIFYKQEDHCKETYEWESTYRLKDVVR